jgi:type I restriction enzyme M protein
MLNGDVKKQINTARDILVGKIPDPKGQIDQITNALIYKFMDDQDRLSQTLPGGKASFFIKNLEKYAWHKLFDSKLSNQDRANLYIEGIAELANAKHLPELFKDVFKDAFLPFRDANTIAMFLNEINKFDYHHSENLGNAFEYLLSIMGSQGDAGQFRTPRNIIEFIVDAVDPTKDDHILDPACGTAGFLIEAYKHITCGSKLTPNEVQGLAKHIHGVDIDPGMAKIARVNLYLHGFKTPLITEDDTLTNESLWGKKYDVILANPPFMTPKGGISPHDKFSVRSNRAEVLFTDYIAEHLKLEGRAGIVVPEGIIFQSGNIYKQLRKKLVDDGYLWAVISLPAGVFNPYSGVKTSILLLDRKLAKENKEVMFYKIENDGFELGTQRKEGKKNDIPEASKAIRDWRENKKIKSEKVFYINKEKVAKDGDYNLSIDRYGTTIDYTNTKWTMVELDKVCVIESGSRQKGGALNEGIYSIGGGQISEDNQIRFENMKFISEEHFSQMNKGVLRKNDVLIVKDGATTGKIGFWDYDKKAAVNEHVYIFRTKENILPKYLFNILLSNAFQNELRPFIKGIIGGISLEIKQIKIPVPPLEIQEQIVTELNGYSAIIFGAKQIIDNWKPKIDVDSNLKIKELKDVCEQITDGTHKTPRYTEKGIPFLRVTDITESNESKKFISKEEHLELIKRCRPQSGDVLYTKNGTIGIAKMIDWDYEFSIFVSLALLKPKKELLYGKYLEYFLNSELALAQAKSHSKSGTITNLHLIEIKQFKIPLPPLETQEQIIKKIEDERKLVESTKKLIEINEEKIKSVIEKLWK